MLDRRAFLVRRPQRCHVGATGQAFRVCRDDHHGVQVQHSEVCEVVTRQGLITEMGVNAAESPQSPGSCPDPPPVR